MKRRFMELGMACLLLGCFLLLSKQAAEISKTSSNANSSKVIVVDPGHGGIDPGVVGIGGLEEKKINLEISLKLKEILEKQGFSVVMTREKDQGLYDETAGNKKRQDMEQRIALIEKNAPILTVSIHQNSFPDSSVKGPQVFYYAGSEESRILAEAIQSKMNTELTIERPRNIKSDSSYFLLKKTSGTIVIVECGFLTNAQEAALLCEKEYQEKAAAAISKGILAYLEENGKKV